MNFDPTIDTQDFAEKAKKYHQEIMSELESYRKDDIDLIVGLDPVGKRYWIGKNESSILEQRQQEGNTNLVYFIKLPRKEARAKLMMSSI